MDFWRINSSNDIYPFSMGRKHIFIQGPCFFHFPASYVSLPESWMVLIWCYRSTQDYPFGLGKKGAGSRNSLRKTLEFMPHLWNYILKVWKILVRKSWESSWKIWTFLNKQGVWEVICVAFFFCSSWWTQEKRGSNLLRNHQIARWLPDRSFESFGPPGPEVITAEAARDLAETQTIWMRISD